MKRLTAIYLIILFLLPLHGLADQVQSVNEPWFSARGENGLYGFIDRDGQWMIQPRYAYTDLCFTGDYVRVGMDELGAVDYEGVIDRQGHWVLPPEYSLYPMDYIGEGSEEGEGLLVVYPSKSGSRTEGYFDLDTGYFSGLSWHEVFHCYTESPLIAVVPEGTYAAGYTDRRTGELVLPALYASVDPYLFHQGFVLTCYEDEDRYSDDYFLMDETGTVIPFPEGIHGHAGADACCGRIAIEDDNGLIGFADLNGRVIIPPQFDWVWDFAEDRAVVCFQEDDYGIIDPEGNVLLRGLTDFWLTGYENGLLTAEKDGIYRCFNLDGKELPCIRPYSMTAGDSLYWMPSNEKSLGDPLNWTWLLADSNGNTLYGPCYLTYYAIDYHQFFTEGLQPVGDSEGHWGYVNQQGKLVIDCVFDRAEPFRFGLAKVVKDGKMMYIDHDGTIVWKEK